MKKDLSMADQKFIQDKIAKRNSTKSSLGKGSIKTKKQGRSLSKSTKIVQSADGNEKTPELDYDSTENPQQSQTYAQFNRQRPTKDISQVKGIKLDA